MHRNDLTRDRRLIEIDWQRMGYTSPQLLNEGASIIASADRTQLGPQATGALGSSARRLALPTDRSVKGNESLATRNVTSPRKVWASGKVSSPEVCHSPALSLSELIKMESASVDHDCARGKILKTTPIRRDNQGGQRKRHQECP